VEYVAPTRDGVVIVAPRKGREYSINVLRTSEAGDGRLIGISTLYTKT
jgi:hypothetical protein